MINGLTVGQFHDMLVFFNQDFPGKQVRSIRVNDDGIVRIMYIDDEGTLSAAVYQTKCEFTAHLV